MTDHLPPQNIEAEQRVLGAVMLDPGKLPEAMEHVRPGDFYLPSHRLIFEAMCALFEKSQALDILTVVDALKKAGKLDAAGGPEHVARLADDVGSARRAGTYARLVREMAILREILHTARAVEERAIAGEEEEAGGLLSDAQRAFLEIGADRAAGKVVAARELTLGTFKHLKDLYERKELLTGLPTGFTDLDKMTAGLQAGELVVVAGRPSMGKTAFALNVAEHAAAEAKRPVAVFSLEMNARALVIRLLCGRAGVNARQLQAGFMPSNKWPDLIRASGEIAEAPLWVDDSARIDTLDILTRARRLQAQEGLALVVVDYLQLIRPRGRRRESREREVAEISAGLKAAAKELDVPVLAVSQLSRGVEGREEKKPRLSDLRESGAIEQDADVVILLYRGEYYRPDDAELKGLATAIVAKQRNGPVGDVDLQFSAEHARFRNLVRFVLHHPEAEGGVDRQEEGF